MGLLIGSAVSFTSFTSELYAEGVNGHDEEGWENPDYDEFAWLGDVLPLDLASDSAGIYAVGSTHGSLEGDRTGVADAFIQKYDNSGKLLWAEQFGWQDSVAEIRAASSDLTGIYVAGSARHDPYASNQLLDDAYIRKYDPDGKLLWADEIKSNTTDWVMGVASDPGGVYVVGYTYGNLHGNITGEENDGFIRKYDSNGTMLWAEQFGKSGYDIPYGIVADITGIYVVGQTTGNLDAQVTGSSDAFIRKYTSEGKVVWTKQYGIAGMMVEARAVTSDPTGIYMVGRSSVEGLDTTDSAFIRKYNANGSELWTQQTDSKYYTFVPLAVSADYSGVYVLSQFNNGVIGDPNVRGSYLERYDVNGKLLWTDVLDITEHLDMGLGSVAGTDGIYLIGVGGVRVDVSDPEPPNAFILKLSLNNTAPTVSDPNPRQDTELPESEEFCDRPLADFATVIIGTNGDDQINGTGRHELIRGGPGDDLIIGMGGNDCIKGEGGDDTLFGSVGNDFIRGGRGDDKIYGNDGNDTLYGNEGDDLISGGTGDDYIAGKSGDDHIFGNDGNDKLFGNEDDDFLKGGEGDDIIFGGGEADEIAGNTGADRLSGQEGSDNILGGRGDDRLDGGGGTDILDGGRNRDRCTDDHLEANIFKNCENHPPLIQVPQIFETELVEVDFEDVPELGDMIVCGRAFIEQRLAGEEAPPNLECNPAHHEWIKSKGLEIGGNRGGFIRTTMASGSWDTGVILEFSNGNSGFEFIFLNATNFFEAEAVTGPTDVYDNLPATVVLRGYNSNGTLIANATHTFTTVTNGQYTPGSLPIATQNSTMKTVILEVIEAPNNEFWIESVKFSRIATQLAGDTRPPAITTPPLWHKAVAGIVTELVIIDYMDGSGPPWVIAYDAVDGLVPVECDPPTGSFFAPGRTEVKCTATDSAGNTAVKSFFMIIG